jgi:hypothetical protein
MTVRYGVFENVQRARALNYTDKTCDLAELY